MTELGTVKNLGRDKHGHEHRERLEAVCECDGCGKDVELWSETEDWIEHPFKPNVWLHKEYGCAQGVCCGNLYVHDFEGCYRYTLNSRDLR